LIKLTSDEFAGTFGNVPNLPTRFLILYDQEARTQIDGTFLVVHTEKIKDLKKKEWVDSKKKQLHFIKVDDPSDIKLVFSIIDADLFIGQRKDTLYFLRENNIIFWKWGEKLCEKVRCFPQIHEKTKDYGVKQYKFTVEQDNALEQAYWVEGHVHDDEDECVSINYKGVGLYTFKTKVKDPDQPSHQMLTFEGWFKELSKK
jgi:hypothetical protein